VVPGTLSTIERSSPVSLLKIEDFPTFGFPTMAILSRLVCPQLVFENIAKVP
jgi:hypothetical protein